MSKKKQNSKVLMEQKRRRRALITFWRIIKYGAHSFIRNAWLSVAATAVMTITLIIIFSSMVSRGVLLDTVTSIKDKVDISVYLKKDVSESDVAKIEKSLENLETVKDVVYVTPEETRQKFSINNASDESIRTALIESEDEFFGVLNVKLVDISNSSELKSFVEKDKLIQKNIHPDHPPTYATERKKAVDNIARSINFAEKVGIIAGTIFTIIASLIIFNTIRMAIFNRREEIYMMKLIGANKSFISGPFLVEAVICGIVAAIFATAICYGVVFSAKSKLESFGIPVDALFKFLQNYVILVVLAMMGVGSIIGVISSWFATRKYLKI